MEFFSREESPPSPEGGWEQTSDWTDLNESIKAWKLTLHQIGKLAFYASFDSLQIVEKIARVRISVGDREFDSCVSLTPGFIPFESCR